MNDLKTKETRLICHLVQAVVGILGHDSPERGASICARHLAGCACCQAHLVAGREIESTLRQEARRERPGVPTGLERRIVHATARSRSPAPARGVPQWAFVAAGAAACLLLGAYAFWQGSAPEMPPAPPPVAFLTLPDRPGEDIWNQWHPSPAALLDAAPLQTEAEAIYADARSAVQFLALNFLPDAPPDF